MYVSLCSTLLLVLCIHYSDAWFLRRASMRRYGERPRIVVGESIDMPAADEVMMKYVKDSAIQKMKEYNLRKQKESSGDDYYELPAAFYPEELSGSASSDSITIGIPMPFIRSSKPKPKKPVSDSDYSTISDKYKDLYPEPETAASTTSVSSSPSPNYMKMIKIDLTGNGSPKNTDSVVKFFKMPESDSVSESTEHHHQRSKKRPTSFIIQWNLPMIFRNYK